MKLIPLLLVFLIASCSHLDRAPSSTETIYSKFSPRTGKEAFDIIYDRISNAKKYVYVTIYSWSEVSLDNALAAACTNGAEVKVAIHSDLFKTAATKKRMEELESKCVEFKKTAKKSHVKFTIVDDIFLVNTSANFSSKAHSTYNESFVFFEGKELDIKYSSILSQFKKEFSNIWNSSSDYLSKDDKVSDKIIFDFDEGKDLEVNMISSTENFEFLENPKIEQAQKDGIYSVLKRKYNKKIKTEVVKEAVLNEINKAKKSIYLNVNHFVHKDLADAILKRAKDDGIEVKIVADNQEYSPKSTKLLVSYMAREWLKLFPGQNPPIRFKYYSFLPNIRFSQMNHNKTIIIDHETKNPVLITGSYNFSDTAENTQFDNLVFYHGKSFIELTKTFVDDFYYLWDYGRGDESVLLTAEKSFAAEDAVYVHTKKPISLDWFEIQALQKHIQKKYGFPFNQYKNMRDCSVYIVSKKKFAGCLPK
ncbi:PLD-like domain protein [Bacteriovorax sp. BSW11_IV]|uniref:phospholipase D-like domain-containing protein n=1 Tax=Bacteriovorax sp. BSW11_IV TaxID=1353529 RepID=UPI000389DF14|nr:phospholipase D-like domain-containing protein [Bacteriovorax sp. BSW11_IV]EQC50027.1 PLD-like domain protein [Bacteriovorax sp. BSW11_IV]